MGHGRAGWIMMPDGRHGNRRKRGPLSAYAVRIRERLAQERGS